MQFANDVVLGLYWIIVHNNFSTEDKGMYQDGYTTRNNRQTGILVISLAFMILVLVATSRIDYAIGVFFFSEVVFNILA